jgi:hypothetical protein
MPMTSTRRLFAVGALLLAFPALAHAYVDPGAGTMILQLLLAGMAGLMIFGRRLRQRVMKFLGLMKKPEQK